MKPRTCLLMLASFLLISCNTEMTVPDRLPDGSYMDVVFDISSGTDFTKSFIPDSRLELDTVDIFIYHSGVLSRSLSMSRSAGGSTYITATQRLILGDTYDILVLANSTVHSAPESLEDALNTPEDTDWGIRHTCRGGEYLCVAGRRSL